MEHRWGKRVAVELDVRIFATPASAGWGRLRDISISGGYVETALRVPVLSTLSLTVPGTGVIHASVVRNDVEGVGVEWFDGQSQVVAALMPEASAAWHGHAHVDDEIRL